LAENVYEGMFILNADRTGHDCEAVAAQICDIVVKTGGEVLVSRFWEERRLAYPIKGQSKGIYWLTYLRLDGRRLGEVRQQCRLCEGVLRLLFLRIDPRIVNALVAHAKAGPVAKGEEQEAPDKDAKRPAAKPLPVAEADDDEQDNLDSVDNED
jgi:small subunit ribosomal protein S6